MAPGTVRLFNDAKGYGFIAPEDGSKDLEYGSRGGRKGIETAVPERSSRHDVCSVCGDKAGAAAVDNTDGWRWFNDGRGGLLPLCSTCAVPEDLLENIPPGTRGATKPDTPGRAAILRARERHANDRSHAP